MDFFSIASIASWTLARTTIEISSQGHQKIFRLAQSIPWKPNFRVDNKKNGEPTLHSGGIMNYLQFYRILPWAKYSFNLDHLLLRNFQIVLRPPQPWWFVWQISNPWEINSNYFSNTMSKLARNECPHVNHEGRVKGLNLVKWKPKCFQFYQVFHSPDMSLTPFNQFPF